MAPLLVSTGDDSATPVSRARKPVRPFIPAIPLLFENKKPKSSIGTPKLASVVDEQDRHTKTSAPKVSSPQGSTAQETEETPRTSPESTTLKCVTTPEALLTAFVTEARDDDTSSTSTFNQDPESQSSGFQLPPAFYPTPAPNNIASNIQPTEFSQPKGFLGHPQPRLFSPYPLDRKIVFGGEPESAQSSPISLPSGSSTTCTQPTPLSDAPSFRPHSQSQSLYQGYGHVPAAYERSIPTNLVFARQQDVYIQPPCKTSSDGGYSQPVPLFPTGYPPHPPSSDQPLIEELLDDERLHFSKLGKHLLDHFNSPSFADCRVVIDVGGTKTYLMLHKMLLSQSRRLHGLFQASYTHGHIPTMVDISLNDRNDSNLRTSSIISALRSFYGEPPSVHAQQVHDLETALAFLAAGRLLQIPEYLEIGTKAVLRYSTMEDVETLLSYALKPQEPLEGQGDRVNDEAWTESDTLDKLIVGLTELLAANYPNNFILDTCAPASKALGGLPPVSRSEPIHSSKPELMAIRFGEFPSASQEIPSAESRVMSTILLAVPSDLLQRILVALGPHTQHDLTEPIVQEREKRRLTALETRDPKSRRARTTG